MTNFWALIEVIENLAQTIFFELKIFEHLLQLLKIFAQTLFGRWTMQSFACQIVIWARLVWRICWTKQARVHCTMLSEEGQISAIVFHNTACHLEVKVRSLINTLFLAHPDMWLCMGVIVFLSLFRGHLKNIFLLVNSVLLLSDICFKTVVS